MLKSVSLLAILVITVSFGLQYVDAQHPGNITIPLGPNNLSIDSITTSGAATLSWNAPDESDVSERDKVDEYLVDVFVGDKIYAGNDTIHVQKSILVDRNPPSAPQSSVTITNLDHDKDYTFVVRSVAVAEALDSHGVPLTRDARAFVEFVPGLFEKYYAATTLERAAQDLVVDVETTSATVKWTAPNNPNVTDKSKFRLNITNDDDRPNGNFTIPNPTNNQYIVEVTGLATGTVYKFEVNTLQGLGPSNNVQVSVTTKTLAESEVEKVKENPSLNNLSKVSTDDSITLSWSNEISTSDFNRCSLEVTQDGKYVRFAYFADPTTSYTIGNLEPSTEYTFVISCGVKDRSNTVTELTRTTATTQGPSLPTDTPVNVNGTVYGDTVYLQWFAPYDIDSNDLANYDDYKIEYSSDDGATWTTYNDGIASNTSAIITGLADGTYIFRVSALSSVGQGDADLSDPITIRQTSNSRPSAPTNLQAETIIGERGLHTKLTWDPPTETDSPITGYHIWYRNDSDINNTGGAKWNQYDHIQGQPYGVNDPTPNQFLTLLYTADGISNDFRVAAVNATGTGAPAFVTHIELPDSEPTPEPSPVPEIPGAVPPESYDEIETEPKEE